MYGLARIIGEMSSGHADHHLRQPVPDLRHDVEMYGGKRATSQADHLKITETRYSDYGGGDPTGQTRLQHVREQIQAKQSRIHREHSHDRAPSSPFQDIEEKMTIQTHQSIIHK